MTKHSPSNSTFQTSAKRRLYLWWSSCTLYLLACQVRVTVGDSGLCCCDTYFQRQLTFLCIESAKTAYRELRISSIRHCLSVDATKTLVVFLCYVTAGYCNATRVVFWLSKQEHVSPLLHTLYWLSICQRISYKLSSICFSSVLGRVFNTLLTSQD